MQKVEVHSYSASNVDLTAGNQLPLTPTRPAATLNDFQVAVLARLTHFADRVNSV
jgi:hypothetical protein